MNEFELEKRLKELKKELSVRHLLFCNNILLGMSQVDAYQDIYKNCDYPNAKSRASELVTNNNQVKEYIELSKQKSAIKTEINIDFIKKELLELYLNAKKLEIESKKVYTKADVYIKMLGQTVVAFADKQIQENETIENIIKSAIKAKMLNNGNNKQLKEVV